MPEFEVEEHESDVGNATQVQTRSVVNVGATAWYCARSHVLIKEQTLLLVEVGGTARYWLEAHVVMGAQIRLEVLDGRTS